MKNIIFTILVAVILGSFSTSVGAQMMGGYYDSSVDWGEVVEHTLLEEKEGERLWNDMQAEEIACEDLDDSQYGSLGEYFMGQMVGDSHADMNAMLIQMHGEEGEKQIHIAMGKRLSGCDTSAVADGIQGGWVPMMNTTWGNQSSPFYNSNNGMMSFGMFGGSGWIFMVLWMLLLISAAIAIIKWIASQSGKTGNHERPALDVLKERYARGEIDKKEFEEKKKEIEL